MVWGERVLRDASVLETALLTVSSRCPTVGEGRVPKVEVLSVPLTATC